MTKQHVDLTQVGKGFLKAEIETGLTFATRAADADGDLTKLRRGRAHAKTAVETVERYLPTLDLTPEEISELMEGLDQLRRRVAALPAAPAEAGLSVDDERTLLEGEHTAL